jgi:hypothetical protein
MRRPCITIVCRNARWIVCVDGTEVLACDDARTALDMVKAVEGGGTAGPEPHQHAPDSGRRDE